MSTKTMAIWRAPLMLTLSLLCSWIFVATSFQAAVPILISAPPRAAPRAAPRAQRQSLSSNDKTTTVHMNMGVFDLFGGSPVRIPKSPADRDNQAISATKAAIASPRTPSCALIECEFPPLESLNKLGDGSLSSANRVDKANLDFAVKLLRSLAPPLPLSLLLFGPNTNYRLLVSSTATNSFIDRANKLFQGGGTGTVSVHSLRDGLPTNVKSREVFVLVAPSVTRDYDAAKRLVATGNTVVLINGFAKDPKSIPAEATMAYFLKPLTYNSQLSGYLTRSYPGKWTCLDATTNEVLGVWTDADVLVPGTNTPDLRTAVRLVQRSVDERAIRARKK